MKLLSPKAQGSRPITDRVKESLFSVLYKYDLPDGKIVADLFCGVGSLGLEALSRAAVFVTFVEKDPKIIAVLEKNVEKAGFAGESKIIRANAFKIGAPVDPVRSKTATLFRSKTTTSNRATSNRVDEQWFDRLTIPSEVEGRYDLIFVDPPYADTRPVRNSANGQHPTKGKISNGTRETKADSPLSPVKSNAVVRHPVEMATSNRVSGLLNVLSEQLSPNGIVVVRTHRRTILLDRYGQFQIIERRQWGTMAVTILQAVAQ